MTVVDRETDEICKDIEGENSMNEISHFKFIAKNETFNGPMEILNHLASKQIMEMFPNLVILCKIISAIPIGVASAEGSFSKLKIIKNYLRSTMNEHRQK